MSLYNNNPMQNQGNNNDSYNIPVHKKTIKGMVIGGALTAILGCAIGSAILGYNHLKGKPAFDQEKAPYSQVITSTPHSIDDVLQNKEISDYFLSQYGVDIRERAIVKYEKIDDVNKNCALDYGIDLTAIGYPQEINGQTWNIPSPTTEYGIIDLGDQKVPFVNYGNIQYLFLKPGNYEFHDPVISGWERTLNCDNGVEGTKKLGITRGHIGGLAGIIRFFNNQFYYATSTATNTPYFTNTPGATNTPFEATNTPYFTNTPGATNTPFIPTSTKTEEPTNTPYPTNTPFIPTSTKTEEPTNTPYPTKTPCPTNTPYPTSTEPSLPTLAPTDPVEQPTSTQPSFNP